MKLKLLLLLGFASVLFFALAADKDNEVSNKNFYAQMGKWLSPEALKGAWEKMQTVGKKEADLPGGQASLSQALNADGTLKAGMDGSFSAKGFRMAYGAGGKPVFLPNSTSTNDSLWDVRMSNGLGSVVFVVASHGGKVYAGNGSGLFSWEGDHWLLLSKGGLVSSAVYSIAFANGSIYVGGMFGFAGQSVTYGNVARFDGTQWHQLGAGVNGIVRSIVAVGNDIYVGGKFDRAGGVVAYRVAKWNGVVWSALGTDFASIHPDREVYALAWFNNQLYAGGDFILSGANSITCLARWNGTVWQSVGQGIGGTNIFFYSRATVSALVVGNSRLYVGGVFLTAGTIAVNNIATWNGTAWSAIGNGTIRKVSSIALDGTNVYVGGELRQSSGDVANYLAYWNGVTWSGVNNNLNNAVNSMTFMSGSLYMGGWFETSGGNPASYTAKWDGLNWQALGHTAVVGTVTALCVVGTDIYVGGNFEAIGGLFARGVAKWNGTNWTNLSYVTLGGGAPKIWDMCYYAGHLYIAGEFNAAGSSGAAGLAKWDGNTWSQVGSGNPFSSWNVYKMVVHQGKLIVAGSFSSINGQSISSIASWDGSQWVSVGSLFNLFVATLATDGNTLYAAGRIAPTLWTHKDIVASWNGSTWSIIADQISGGSVTILTTLHGNLIAAGSFGAINTVMTGPLAQWNGVSWSKFIINGTIYGYGVTALSFFGDEGLIGTNDSIYIMKARTVKALSQNANVLAVRAISVLQDGWLVAGGFMMAGDKAASRLAIYRNATTLPLQSLLLTGKAQNSAALLTWRTQGETDVDRHEVQRARGNRFETIGQQPARNTAEASYQFTDDRAETGDNLYRIRTVDKDGKEQFSQTVLVRLGSLSKLSLTPNPVADQLNIRLDGLNAAEPTVLKVVDMAGNLVFTQSLGWVAVINQSIQLTKLAAGNYLVQLQNGQEMVSEQILKQ